MVVLYSFLQSVYAALRVGLHKSRRCNLYRRLTRCLSFLCAVLNQGWFFAWYGLENKIVARLMAMSKDEQSARHL